MRPLILVLLVTALGTSFAGAQNQNLLGIARLNLLVDGLDQYNVSCGISEDVVRRAVTSAFEESDVTVSAASEPVLAFVRVTTTTYDYCRELRWMRV